jgi:hypothetical protein
MPEDTSRTQVSGISDIQEAEFAVTRAKAPDFAGAILGRFTAD